MEKLKFRNGNRTGNCQSGDTDKTQGFSPCRVWFLKVHPTSSSLDTYTSSAVGMACIKLSQYSNSLATGGSEALRGTSQLLINNY